MATGAKEGLQSGGSAWAVEINSDFLKTDSSKSALRHIKARLVERRVGGVFNPPC